LPRSNGRIYDLSFNWVGARIKACCHLHTPYSGKISIIDFYSLSAALAKDARFLSHDHTIHLPAAFRYQTKQQNGQASEVFGAGALLQDQPPSRSTSLTPRNIASSRFGAFLSFRKLRAESCLILGKCVRKLHFLDIGWISSSFAQAKCLTSCLLKKIVSLVSLVSTVSF
jgi:hypothetical protein